MQFRKIILAFALCASVAGNAQTGGSNSSYSRFGMGSLADASSSANVVMGGTGVALRAGNRVNMLNPASYAVCDSLAFVCDIGMAFHFGHFSTPTASKNVRNTSLSNVNAMFRIRRGLGMSIGFVPYSSIGYDFTNEATIGKTELTQKPITTTRAYSGSGGLHNVYAGLGWMPFKDFSVGVNLGFLWGEYNHVMPQNFLEGGSVSGVYDGLHTTYTANLGSYKIDAGVQYSIRLKDNNRLMLGAIVGVGHKMAGDATVLRHTTNGDSVARVLPKAFDVPWSYGVGATWYQGTRWTVTADYRSELWSKCRLPQITYNGNSAADMQAASITGAMIDRHRVGVGMEYTPDIYSSYLKRIHYRLGVSYTSPYYKVNGYDGPSEYSVGLGFGLPITSNINSRRSVVNVGFQWTRVQPGNGSDIKEDYFKINLGITFNEQWFMKWKIR